MVPNYSQSMMKIKLRWYHISIYYMLYLHR